MNEQDFQQRIREITEETPIPESLSPEHILNNLNEPPRRKRWYQHPWMNVAASFALLGIITSAIIIGLNQQPNNSMDSSSMEGNAMDTEKNEVADNAVFEDDSACAESVDETGDCNAGNHPIATPEDYKELFGILDEFSEPEIYFETDGAIQENAVASDGASFDSTEAGSSATNATDTHRYSDTNSQVEAVAEADIVKTDGSYIYSCYSERDYTTNAVAIAKADNGTLSAAATISPEEISKAIACDDFNIREMYICDNKLILLCVGTQTNGTWRQVSYGVPDSLSITYILTYDVSTPSNPKVLGVTSQDGSYNSSRLVDGYLYTFSIKHTQVPNHHRAYEAYVPNVNGELLLCPDIYLPTCPNASIYQIMTGMDINQADSFVSSKAVLSGTGTYYVSTEHIFFAQTTWGGVYGTEGYQTEILRFHYKDGIIQPEGSIAVDGYLLNQFSMDEYDGYLRLVATVDNENALYVINKQMQLVGTIDNLAPDERVYSARFMGDVGYFVTYRETDPLFAVDLSDPENPEIMDALKIPGFSNYLHFYSEDLLFGFGEEINPITGEFMGLKLSMFDISDPYNITEADKTVLKNAYYSVAQYNHKSLLIDPEMNLIGFYTECYDETTYEYVEAYAIYSYVEGKGFQEEFTCALSEDEILADGIAEYSTNFYNIRGLYIDDYLYLINGNRFSSYSLDTYEYVEGLIIRGDGNHIHKE